MSNRIQFHYPTPEQMTALTAAAHRNRARLMKVIMLKGVRALKSRFAHAVALPSGNRVSHA